MNDWPQFRKCQIDWPDESEKWRRWSALPKGWSIWLKVRVDLVHPADLCAAVVIDFSDPPVMETFEYELDDYLEKITPDLTISVNECLLARSLESVFSQRLAYALIKNATLRVQRRDAEGNQWEIALDTECGYLSQVRIDSFPWEEV